MGLAMRGGGLLVYLPTLSIGTLLIVVSAPLWYWILGICLCVTYVETTSSIPLLKKKESYLFDKWDIAEAVAHMQKDEERK